MKSFAHLILLFGLVVPAAGQQVGRGAVEDFVIEVGRAGVFEVGMTLREIFMIVEPDQVDLGFGTGEGYATPMVLLDLVPEREGPEIIGLLDRLECSRIWEWNVQEASHPRSTVSDNGRDWRGLHTRRVASVELGRFRR